MVSLNFVLLFYNGLHQRVWTHVPRSSTLQLMRQERNNLSRKCGGEFAVP